MMNKKGITLVEIVISVALISVVMLFLFRLLTDMQYERDHASYAKSNQQVRASIMEHIQNDFQNLGLQSVTLSEDKKSILFAFQNSVSKTLNLTDHSLTYADEETWEMKKDNDDTKIDIGNVEVKKYFPDPSCNDLSSTGNCSTYASYHIIIPVVTGLNTNVIDDIELFYIGLASKMS